MVSNIIRYNRFMLMLNSGWKIGRELFKKDDLKGICAAVLRKSTRKWVANRSITALDEITDSSISVSEIKPEMEVEMPPWTKSVPTSQSFTKANACFKGVNF